jgi:hypothetical protein
VPVVKDRGADALSLVELIVGRHQGVVERVAAAQVEGWMPSTSMYSVNKVTDL